MAEKHKTPTNPYMAGRLEWNERYGSLIVREKRWRMMAFLSALVALIAVGGVVYIGAQSKFVPYVVEVDRFGRTQAVGTADQVQPSSARVKKAELQDFIADTRSVYVDAAAMRDNIEDAYALVPNGVQAHTFLNEFFRNREPFKTARTHTISVDLHSALPLSNNTWQVEWTETTRARKGGEVVGTPKEYRAVITLEDVAPSSEAGIIRNPANIHITSLNWTEID